MLTCRLAIMSIYATLGAAGAAHAGSGDVVKGPWPADCLICHATADRGGHGPLIASAGGRTPDAATGFRFCDGPLTVGELSIGKMSDRPDRRNAADRLAFLKALSGR